MVKCAPKRRGYCSSPGSDFHHPPILVGPHDHPARIAGQPLRRSRGNARSVLQRGLAGLGRIRQNGGVHMDDHLVPLPGRSGVELLMQRYLGEQGQGIRLLLRPGRGLHRRVGCCRPEGATALVERISGRVERTQEHRPHLWRKPAPKHHGSVIVRVDVQRTARMLARGLAALRLPVHLAPSLHDALHVNRGARPRHREQTRLGRGGRDTTERTDLGIRELTPLQSRRHPRQRPEGAGYAHAFASGAGS